MDNKRLEKWKLKTKGIFHKITYDEFWFYIDDLMKENKKLTNNWNELEEWIMENVKDEKPDLYFQVLRKIDILDKMKEIKDGNNVSDRN